MTNVSTNKLTWEERTHVDVEAHAYEWWPQDVSSWEESGDTMVSRVMVTSNIVTTIVIFHSSIVIVITKCHYILSLSILIHVLSEMNVKCKSISGLVSLKMYSKFQPLYWISNLFYQVNIHFNESHQMVLGTNIEWK